MTLHMERMQANKAVVLAKKKYLPPLRRPSRTWGLKRQIIAVAAMVFDADTLQIGFGLKIYLGLASSRKMSSANLFSKDTKFLGRTSDALQ